MVYFQWMGNLLTASAIYHPPKPIYDTSTFSDFLLANVGQALSVSPCSLLFLAGDFNTLQPSIPALTGLFPTISAPTRQTAILDQLFISTPKPFTIKIVKSTVKSDHSLIIISDSDQVTNIFKQRNTLTYRSKSPAQHARFLANSSAIDLAPVSLSSDTETCSALFHSTLSQSLNTHYPLKTITITDSDPPL
jgi:hypothetical protein